MSVPDKQYRYLYTDQIPEYKRALAFIRASFDVGGSVCGREADAARAIGKPTQWVRNLQHHDTQNMRLVLLLVDWIKLGGSAPRTRP